MDPKAEPRDTRTPGAPVIGPDQATPELAGFLQRGIPNDARVEVFPRMVASEAKYMDLVITLFTLFRREFPVSEVSGSGRLSPGIGGDWTQMLTVPGVFPTPAGIPPTDRIYIRKATLMVAGATQAQRSYAETGLLRGSTKLVFQTVVDLLCKRGEPGSVPIKRQALMGLPEMSRAIERKMRVIDLWHSRPGAILSRFGTRDWKGLWEQFGFLTAYANGYRNQLDGWTFDKPSGKWIRKPREVYSFKKGWVLQDKSPPPWLEKNVTAVVERLQKLNPDLPGIGLSTTRARQISMAPLGGTYPLRIVFYALWEYLIATYRSLFEIEGAETLNAMFDGVEAVFMFDVKNHDQMAPAELLEMMIAAIGKYFNEDVVTMVVRALFPSMLVKEDRPGKSGWRWVGQPLEGDLRQIDAGNNSGNPLTAWIAKVLGVAYMVGALWWIKDKYPALSSFFASRSLEEAIHELLSNATTSPVVLANAGDNAVVAPKFPCHDFERHFLEALECTRWTKADSFVGYVPIQDPGTPLRWERRIASYWFNFYQPEKGVQSPIRKFWATGWEIRRQIYQGTPGLAHMESLITRVFMQKYGVSPQQFVNLWRPKEPPLQELKSVWDQLFLLNPDIIYYRTTADVIDPALVDEVYISVPPERYRDLWRLML